MPFPSDACLSGPFAKTVAVVAVVVVVVIVVVVANVVMTVGIGAVVAVTVVVVCFVSVVAGTVVVGTTWGLNPANPESAIAVDGVGVADVAVVSDTVKVVEIVDVVEVTGTWPVSTGGDVTCDGSGGTYDIVGGFCFKVSSRRSACPSTLTKPG